MHLLLITSGAFKIWIFTEKNLKNFINSEERKGTRYIRGNFYLTIMIFRLQNHSQISFNFLCSGDKRFLSGFFQK